MIVRKKILPAARDPFHDPEVYGVYSEIIRIQVNHSSPSLNAEIN